MSSSFTGAALGTASLSPQRFATREGIARLLPLWKRCFARLGRFFVRDDGLLLIVGLDDRRERRHALVAAEPHDDHALGGPSKALDVLDRDADHRAAVRDQHDLVALTDDARSHEVSPGLRELNGLHAHPAAAL